MTDCREAFPKGRRLRRPPDFDRVLDGPGAARASGRHFLVVARRGEEPRGRLGIVASRRVGSSVHRNRVKRRVREWFRRGPAVGPYDVAVIVKVGAEALDARRTAEELSELVARATARAARETAGRERG